MRISSRSSMQSEENQIEEIDLYSIIELLWSNRFVILGAIFLFVAVTVAVLFFNREKSNFVRGSYVTSTVTYAPDDVILKKFSGKIRGKEVLRLDGVGWLISVANAIKTELLRDAYEWTTSAGSPVSDWLSTNLKNSLSDDQQFDEFLKRVAVAPVVPRIGTKLDDQKTARDKIQPKLILTFISDTPVSGAEISQNIIKLAQERAFEMLKAEYVNNIYSLLDEEDAEIFSQAEKLYVARISERINAQENEEFTREGIGKFYVEKVLGTEISDATRYEYDFNVKDGKNMLDEEILALIEQMRALREKHTELVLSRERNKTFLPNISSEELITTPSSSTESMSLPLDWYEGKSAIKALSTAAFLGLIGGIILVLILDGFEKRRSFRLRNG